MTRVPRPSAKEPRATRADGVVDVRLWGREKDVTGVADAISQMADVTVLKRSEPLVTRDGSAQRIYLTVMVSES